MTRLALACLLTALVLWAQILGPKEGLLIPVWDALYGRYAFLNVAQFQALMGGGATISGKTLIPGGSILFATIPNSDALLLDIDRRNVKHGVVQEPPPALGSTCEDLGAEILSDALYLCRANSTDNYGKWVKIQIQTQ